MSIKSSGQDSETTIVLNTAPNTYATTRKTIAPDQMKSEQLVHEIKADSKLRMYNSKLATVIVLAK